MSEEELNRLCGYITEYSLGDTPCEVSPVSVDSALKTIDLMHFAWNIGKAFGKKRTHTAIFIKRVFAHALRDIEVSTIERKMSHTESECRIKLDENITFPLLRLSRKSVGIKLEVEGKTSFVLWQKNISNQ